MTKRSVKRNKTKRVLAQMLKEDTGAHFLDSGAFFGRHWERNQFRVFDNEPPGELKFYLLPEGYRDIDVGYNTYHFLLDRLTYDEEMDNLFHAWANREENRGRSWLELMDEWPEVYVKEANLACEIDSFGIVNTYNYESFLDQVIQYHLFSLDYTDFCLLQIHNGADVRGGYTIPRAFRGGGQNSELTLLDDSRVTIVPAGVDWWKAPMWSNHYYGGFTFDVEHRGDFGSEVKSFSEYEWSRDESDRGKGKLYVDQDGAGYCPHTGGQLMILC